MAGATGLLLAAAIGSYFSLSKKATPRTVTPPSSTSAITAVSLQPPALLPSSVSPGPMASPRTDYSQILKNASREECLAVARDLLAKGGSLGDIIALLEYLSASKPEFAIDLARDIGRTDGERHVLLYAVLSDWARIDAPAALQWAFQKSGAYNVPGNASLLYIVLEQVAGDNPRAALAVAEEALRPNPGSLSTRGGSDVARLTIEALIRTGRGDLAQQAFERWARGPEAAGLNETAYEVIALSLAQKSLSSAALWLQSLPSSPARNQALAPFAATWSQQDGRAAMDWAQGLDPADGGDDVRVATFERWLKSDRSAATQWLLTHETPDNTRLLVLLNPQK
jgi:hypothetical protein